jgi:SAM-dependent methyltransferase
MIDPAVDPARIGAALSTPYRPTWGCPPDDLQVALDLLYDYRDDPETRVLHRSRLNRFDAFVRGLMRRGAISRKRAALDLGCNAGYYSKMISDLGFAEVLGVDIEPEFIARACRYFASDVPRSRRKFEVANAEELDAPDRFDFILCTEVIEHTARPDRVLANLARALAPGGIAVVTLPNRISIPYAWAMLVHALKRRPVDPVLRDHLSWPFTRALGLLEPYGLERIASTGANLTLTGPVIRALHRAPGFGALHRGDAAVAGLPGLHRLAQFFFTAWRRPG